MTTSEMFLAEYRNGTHSFAAAADLVSLQDAEINPALSLREIAESGKPLYLRVSGKFRKHLLRVILKYYSIRRDVSAIRLFAECPNTGDWSFIRPCQGPTLAVVGSLMQSLPYSHDIVDDFLAAITDNHPATCAAGYAQVNGGNITAVWNVINQIGDIRDALVRAVYTGYSAESITNNLQVVRKSRNFSTVVSKGIFKTVEEYCLALDGHKDFMPVTFEDQLILATFGYPLSAKLPGSLSHDVMFGYNVREYGMAAACVTTLQLVTTSWAAAEFHSDMFDEAVFYPCPTHRAKEHIIKYRQVCRG